MVSVSVQSKRYNCSIELHEKITVIIGDSGVGKTEFTRRVLNDRANKIEVSNGYDIVVLTENTFKSFLKRALDRKKNSEVSDEKFLKDFWVKDENLPFVRSIVIVDDEDFVKSVEFSILISLDVSNYYILINRCKLPNINYSASEVYKFVKDGVNHIIEKYYSYGESVSGTVDVVLVEGKGSDYTYFKNLFRGLEVVNPTSYGNVQEAGKSNVIKFLEINNSILKGKSIYLIVDVCSFGSDIYDLYETCLKYDLSVTFDIGYKSFEYMLLVSNFINDKGVDEYTQNNIVKIPELEKWYYKRLMYVTKGTTYEYSKSVKKFSKCYYQDCCTNRENIGSCDKSGNFLKGDKFYKMLKGTTFENFLSVREGGNLSV